MKPKTSFLFAIVILGLVAFVIFAQKRSQNTKTVIIWEYQTLACSTTIQNLNRLGSEGWELVTTGYDGSNCVSYFKRHK